MKFENENIDLFLIAIENLNNWINMDFLKDTGHLSRTNNSGLRVKYAKWR
jgi:hypothetical protein